MAAVLSCKVWKRWSSEKNIKDIVYKFVVCNGNLAPCAENDPSGLARNLSIWNENAGLFTCTPNIANPRSILFYFIHGTANQIEKTLSPLYFEFNTVSMIANRRAICCQTFGALYRKKTSKNRHACRASLEHPALLISCTERSVLVGA